MTSWRRRASSDRSCASPSISQLALAKWSEGDGHGQDATVELFEQAERSEEVIIARGKTPVARLVPYAGEQSKRRFGSMKGARHDRAGVLGAAARREAMVRASIALAGSKACPAPSFREPIDTNVPILRRTG
jgi:antitoxin (DNA-binding transcriptional repressor) of toxin-antitoxin stability system